MTRGSTATVTGGRAATTRHIPPQHALAVGMPSVPPPAGWRWVRLADVARLESGHTPSRRHPEWWGGEIPWLSLKDAKVRHGGRISDTTEHTNELGIANSSARILPADTVCLSRTASVGYVVVMDRPMATSQDFVSWVCADEVEPDFLKYLFLAEGPGLLRFATGAVHSTIYFPEVKAFHVALPPRPEQRRIVDVLDEALAGIAKAREHAERNLRNARALFESCLDSAFSRVGQGWAERRLGQAVDATCTLSYGIVQPGEERPHGLPVVRPTDLTTKSVSADGLKRIDPKRADGYVRTRLCGGDLLLCVRGSTGMVSVASAELAGANVTRGIVPIRFDPGLISQEFGYYLLRSGAVQRQMREKTYGAALMQINIRDVRNLRISYPSLGEQADLVSRLDGVSVASARLEASSQRKLAALDELKQSLLHQAFSGEL